MKRMINQQLIDYIKEQQQRNVPRSEIEKVLLELGWQKGDIDEGFKTAPPPLPPTNVFVSPPVISDGAIQSAQTTTVQNKFMGPIAILKESWRICKERYWKFIGIVLIPVAVQLAIGVISAIVLVLSGIGSTLLPLFSGGIKTGNFLRPQNGAIAVLLVVFALIFGIISLILQIWAQVALLTEAVSETKIGIKEAYSLSKGKRLRFLGLTLLSAVVVWGGFLLLIVPGVILAIGFSFTTNILVVENIGGMRALLKSKEYVRGYWWKVFGRLLFIGLFLGMFSVLPQALTPIFKQLNLPTVGVIISFVFSIISVLLFPLSVIYVAVMYRSLKATRGEVDITGRSKTGLILLGILGALIIPAIFALGILSAINPLKQVSKAQDAQRKLDILSIRVAVERYYAYNSKCPQTLNELVGSEFKSIPTDPRTKLPYDYKLLPGGNNCSICAQMEGGGETCLSVPEAEGTGFPSLPKI